LFGASDLGFRIFFPIIPPLSFAVSECILKFEMTLTETAQLTKKTAVALVIISTAGFTGREVWTRAKTLLFPPKLPPPEVAFGKLPSPQIPRLPFKGGSSPQYVVDTTTGRLPTDLPDRAKVYKIILPTVTHLTSQRAKNLAAELGFSKSPQKLSSSDYFWTDPEAGRSLEMNITTGNFLLETEIKKLSDLRAGTAPSKASAVEQAKMFFQNLGILSEDYANGRQEASYLKIEGGSLKRVESLSEAQLTRIDFFREIDEQPIVGQKPFEGLLSVILKKEGVAFVVHRRWPLDPEQSTTYPLKTAEQVWNEVEGGQARLVHLAPAKADPFSSYEPRDPKTIFVRRIFLGYFDSQKLQDYLQPIYILEGLAMTADRQQLKFIAYLPALTDDWVLKEE